MRSDVFQACVEIVKQLHSKGLADQELTLALEAFRLGLTEDEDELLQQLILDLYDLHEIQGSTPHPAPNCVEHSLDAAIESGEWTFALALLQHYPGLRVAKRDSIRAKAWAALGEAEVASWFAAREQH